MTRMTQSGAALATVLLLTFAFAAQAQERSDLPRIKQERIANAQAEAAKLAGLARGRALLSAGERYVLLTEVRAVSLQDRRENPARRLEAMGLASSAALGTQGRFLLFKPPAPAAATPMLAKVNQEPSHPVVLNERTGRLGVVLGSIVVRIENAAEAGAIAAEHGLKLGAAFPHLGTASFDVPPGMDIFAAGESLAADPRVIAADVEISENPRVPQ